MKLIVGLGNPGRTYVGTRHNVGYEVLAELARNFGSGAARLKFQGEVVEACVEGERALLLAPHTYMNKSGDSVQPARDYYRLENKDLLIVCDDFHLPLGKLRFRARGSAGGQKGLGDVIRRLGSEEFGRLRIGVGPLPEGWDATGFVLGRFRPQDAEQIKDAIKLAAQGVAAWTREGIEYCMNHYN